MTAEQAAASLSATGRNMDCSAHLFGRSSALSFSVGRSILVELLTKDQARRIACDDGGSRKDKRPNHQSGRLAISQCFYFDFFWVLLCFFAMALLLDVPLSSHSGALQVNAE